MQENLIPNRRQFLTTASAFALTPRLFAAASTLHLAVIERTRVLAAANRYLRITHHYHGKPSLA